MAKRKDRFVKYHNDLPADAVPGDLSLYDGVLWRCSVYSKNQPDCIKWRRVPISTKKARR
jgi:hypothetical protein